MGRTPRTLNMRLGGEGLDTSCPAPSKKAFLEQEATGLKVKVKVGKSLHRLNFPVLTSSFRPLFDLPDAPSAVPPTSSEWVPGRPVPKPWRFY